MFPLAAPRNGAPAISHDSEFDGSMYKLSHRNALLAAAAFLVLAMTNEDAFPQDRGQGRSMVISQSGIVATESPLASQAGAAVLQRGGNAVDAAIAAHAVMTVVAPMWNGIGGDLFAIVYDAKVCPLDSRIILWPILES